MRTVLLGDSHLARVRRGLSQLAGPVVNAAVGGADAADLLPQARAVGAGPDDVVVVSVGTNDAAPWKAVPHDEFALLLDEVLSVVDAERWVYVAPPGVDEARLTRRADRTNADLAVYAGIATTAFTARSGTVVDSAALLGGLGPAAFTDDGVHLTGAAYRLLLPAIADATK